MVHFSITQPGGIIKLKSSDTKWGNCLVKKDWDGMVYTLQSIMITQQALLFPIEIVNCLSNIPNKTG